VRFHLKNAFAKTEARGQVALAALIRRFARH
jgi:DNA-binding CsgD family transcriptional regulator